MKIPVSFSDVRVSSSWSPELAEAVEHFIYSSAADPVSCLASLALDVLAARPHTAQWLVFSAARPSLFKAMVALADTPECWLALEEVCDADVIAATNVARWILRLPQQVSSRIVFVDSPFALTPASGPAPRAPGRAVARGSAVRASAVRELAAAG